MVKTKRVKGRELLPQKVSAPKIPRAFVENFRIGQVLYLTINEFSFEDQAVIFLYCFVNLPISEAAKLTGLPASYIVGVLALYYEKLKLKLGIFKQAVPYDVTDLVSVKEMFEQEAWEWNGFVQRL